MSRGERGSQVVRIIQGIDHQDGEWLQHGHEFPQHSRREGACRASAKGRRNTAWRVGCGHLTAAGQWSSRDHMEDVPVLHRLESGRPIFFNLVEPLDIEATQQPLDLPACVERHLSMR